MRSTPRASLALSVLVLPLVLAAPVVTLPGSDPAPVPVTTELHTVPLPPAVLATTPSPDDHAEEHHAEDGAHRRAAVAGAPRSTVVLGERRTEEFSTLGVTWRAQAATPDVHVLVRTRTEGRWTGWVDLEGQTDDTADEGVADTARASLREGTRPLWVGPSDGVDVRVEVHGPAPADLRVDLIDPGTSPADDLSRALPADVAGASEPQPAVVTRAEWGADESMKRCVSGYTGTPRVAFVHHTASTNDYTPEQAPAAVRGFYAYHVKSNGWCDIGYNFLVDRYGVVYEGRFGGIDAAVLGAHTGGFNANSFGTAMIGNFATVDPPQALRDSLRTLLAWKLGRSYADPSGTARLTAQGGGSRFASGSTQTFDVVSGHRDAVNTSCPGDVGYRILQQLRADVRTEMGASFVAPSATPLTTSSTPVALSAGLLQPLDWRLEVTSAETGLVVRTLTGSAADRVETTWDLLDDTGLQVAPGTYRATLYGGTEEDPATPWSAAVTVQPPPGSSPTPTAAPSVSPSVSPTPVATRAPSPSPSPARTAAPSPSPTRTVAPSPTRTAAPVAPAPRGAAFVPLSPVRVLDTRDGTGGRRTPLGAAETFDLVLAGRNGVPADATAVAVNLTATRPSSGTHLTVWPAGQPQPETAVLNLRPGGTAASLVVAGLGRGGAASVRNLAGTVEVVADVVGYWTRSPGALYHPVQPARLLDTRRAQDGARRIADQETQDLVVRGRGGVPAEATAVVLNVTAVGPTRAGYVTVTPAGVRGTTSSVNYAAGETVPNRVVTGLSSSGAVDLFVAGSSHVLVDVVGWFAPPSVAGGSAFTALTPSRLVDSRDGTGTPRQRFGPQTTRDVQVTGRGGVPAGATAVVVSLTGTGPTASQTFVSAFPDGTALPGTSDLNLVQGQTRSNLAVVPLSSAGKMSLYNEGGTTHVIADVLGYYSG